MEQSVIPTSLDRRQTIDRITQHAARAIEAAPEGDTPFFHLVLGNIFPDDIYQSMLTLMPEAREYRPMHGRSRGNDMEDGTHTRVKIDLFPEYIRNLPPEKRALWDMIGRALTSRDVKEAFQRRLAPGLKKRFGSEYSRVGMYPIPILTRDIPGYKINPHTDTHWKGMTIQLYLPRDAQTSHIGTIFHEVLPNGELKKHTQMQFVPNSGYAFAVGDDTWHSADPVGQEVKTRDSILLTYFVDAGFLRILRNRSKRFGNFLLNEVRAKLR